jgi:phenylalanyl-tRNA synthetase beta chain
LKISLNWINDFIDLSGIPVDEIVHKLTMSGLEVEDVIDERKIYKDFVVGFVKEKKKHPNADKLSVCTVWDGKHELQVICGAPNVEVNQKIVFASIGTIIAQGQFKLSKAKIRGVESFGMICSEAELELSDNHEGIMVLNDELKPGEKITSALGLNDVILEVAITPNRPDALSHIGVARDLAAIFNIPLTVPAIKIEETAGKISDIASVEIIDVENCPRYSAMVVQEVEIKDSPEWLSSRLKKIGLRPINNVVDVTNYIMYETGQPLHAFDLVNLEGNKIIVRSTDEESKFVTLDSKERVLPKNSLLICDAVRPVAIAGIMGGENSEVTSTTKDILIESAYFYHSSIRRTSKSLGLTTESSYRFERGTDPSNTLYAAQKAAQLIAELSSGKIAEGFIDVYPNPIKQNEIKLRYSRITKLLGYEIPQEKISEILFSLGCEIKHSGQNEVLLLIPTFRPDIEREVDLIEEIARIYGYDSIPTIETISVPLDIKHDESYFVDNIKNIASGLGFYEMINNPLQSESVASITGNKIKILNPQSQDMAYLRTSLIPGALQTIARNISVGEKDLYLFEVGNVFNKHVTDEIESFDDFSENQNLLFIITGRAAKKSWLTEETQSDFYILKGIIHSFLIKISLDNVLIDSYYNDGKSLFDYYFVKSYNKRVVGTGGKVNKNVLKFFDINQDVFCFEFNLDELKQIPIDEKRYKELLKYPKVFRDFAFIFDREAKHNEVIEFIKREGSKLLKSVRLFDLFESETIGTNKKSMAFALEYYDVNRTLTEEEVDKEFTKLITAVTKSFNAKLRG